MPREWTTKLGWAWPAGGRNNEAGPAPTLGSASILPPPQAAPGRVHISGASRLERRHSWGWSLQRPGQDGGGAHHAVLWGQEQVPGHGHSWGNPEQHVPRFSLQRPLNMGTGQLHHRVSGGSTNSWKNKVTLTPCHGPWDVRKIGEDGWCLPEGVDLALRVIL